MNIKIESVKNEILEGKEISKIKEIKKFVRWLSKNNYEYEIPKTYSDFKDITLFIKLHKLDSKKESKLYRYIERYVNYVNKKYVASFTALRIDI